MKKTRYRPKELEKDESVDLPASADTGAQECRGMEPKRETGPAATDDALAEETAALREKVERLEDALLRARADYQNFQRRSAAERAEAIRYANAALMRSLLNVLDDFERALTASTDDVTAVSEGIRLVYENFLKALREHGLDTIDTADAPFDPSVHEALMQQASADHPQGTVLQELARGYKLRDRVLRPSKVIVSKAVEPAAKDAKPAREPKADAAGQPPP